LHKDLTDLLVGKIVPAFFLRSIRHA
jgi:hypothetical protein